jgi:hypothetical protein
MTSAPDLSVRASSRNALIRRLYQEFPQVPAGAIADAVLQAWGDLLLPPGENLSSSALREEFVEQEARERLLQWRRRAELATRRVAQHHPDAAGVGRLRHSA